MNPRPSDDELGAEVCAGVRGCWLTLQMPASRGGLASLGSDIDRFIANGGGGIVGLVWILATIVPALSVLVRRLHDTGRSGWWALIGFVPLVGGIVLFVFSVSDSHPGENTYGPSPKVGATQ